MIVVPGSVIEYVKPRLHRPSCSVGCTVSHAVHDVTTFFSQFAQLRFTSLLIGVACYGMYLLLRSRALWAALQTAYPGTRVRWRDVWGAYMSGYAVNNVFPLGG